MNRRSWILSASLLGWTTMALAAPLPASLNLEEALEVALKNSPVVEAARAKADAAKPMTGLAIAHTLPSLLLTGSAVSRQDALSSGNPAFSGQGYNVYSVGLKLSQPLYEGGLLPAELRNASREQRIRELDVAIAERDLGVVLIEAYHSILLEQVRAQLNEEDRGLQKELLAIAKKRQAIGRAQLLDVLQIESQLAAIEPRIARARNTMEGWAATLAQALGEPELKAFQLEGRLQPFKAGAMLSIPVKPVAELERASLVREQQDAKADIRLAPYSPRVDAVANLNRYAYVREDLLDPYSTAWSAGLEMSWPLFKGLASVHDKRELGQEARRLEVEETRVREEKAVAQIRARQAVEIAQSVVESSQATAELQRRTLNEARRLYQLSTIDTQQFLIIQQAELNSRIALAEAVNDLIVQSARYCAASGIPLSELLKILEEKS